MNDYFKNENSSRNEQPKQSEYDYNNFQHKWSYDRYTQNTSATPATAKKHKSSSKGLKIFAIVVSAAFLVTLSCFATFIVMNSKNQENNIGNYSFYPTFGNGVIDNIKKVYTTADSTKNVLDSEVSKYTGAELTNREIIELAKPSVVGIVTSVRSYFGYVKSGVGSGFIISADGYIITNYHVIENASSVSVVLSDDTEHNAEVIGYDSLTDVAVLKITVDKELPALIIGDSDNVCEGDSVIAIGTPSGIELAGTATHGMISAVNRVLEITDIYGRVTKTMTVIQTDAAINPGNSGGPLLNSRGEVIGVNTLKLSDTSYQGIGFAIPINGVMDIVDQLIENGVVIERPANSYVTGKASLGISHCVLSENEAKQYGVAQGLLILQVTPYGPAGKYGIKRGDIITAFDGTQVKSSAELSELLGVKKAGDTVVITVFRDDYMDITVTLGQAVS